MAPAPGAGAIFTCASFHMRQADAHQVGRHVEQFGGEFDQLARGQEDMAVFARLVERIADAGRHAPGASGAMPMARAILSAVRKPMPKISRARR